MDDLQKPCILSPHPFLNKDSYGERYHHRLVYKNYHKVDIAGKVIRHKCDNGTCIEITHLEIGTQADNMRDRMERGTYNQGTLNGKSVLSEEAIIDIREMYDEGYSYAEIAREFDVHRSTIRRLILGIHYGRS